MKTYQNHAMTDAAARPALAAACKQVQQTGAGHQILHAGDHGLLNTVDRRAGDILARQCLQVFTPGGTGNYTHGHAPLF